jgi:hypothetical protein
MQTPRCHRCPCPTTSGNGWRHLPGDDLRPPETCVPLATLTRPFTGSDFTRSLQIQQSSEPQDGLAVLGTIDARDITSSLSMPSFRP